jgi:hypothetical protein
VTPRSRRSNGPVMVEIVRSEGGRLRCGATRWFVIDAGRPFFIGQPTCGVVERQGSEPATSRRPDSTRLSAPGRASVIPGGGNSRPHPGGGCHLAKSRRDTWRCCSWGSLFRSGRFSRPEEILRLLFIALVGLGLNSAVVLLLAKFCGSSRRSPKSLPSFPCSNWTYLGRRSIVFDGTRPL